MECQREPETKVAKCVKRSGQILHQQVDSSTPSPRVRQCSKREFLHEVVERLFPLRRVVGVIGDMPHMRYPFFF